MKDRTDITRIVFILIMIFGAGIIVYNGIEVERILMIIIGLFGIGSGAWYLYESMKNLTFFGKTEQ
jgi:hypothetical protein